jgi:hypothetical protein
MSIHEGPAWLALSNDNQVLEGLYYSGRGRQTHGQLGLRRLPFSSMW